MLRKILILVAIIIVGTVVVALAFAGLCVGLSTIKYPSHLPYFTVLFAGYASQLKCGIMSALYFIGAGGLCAICYGISKCRI